MICHFIKTYITSQLYKTGFLFYTQYKAKRTDKNHLALLFSDDLNQGKWALYKNGVISNYVEETRETGRDRAWTYLTWKTTIKRIHIYELYES